MMKKILSHPLISCICITNNRPAMLMRAISCFDTQNYPNRELIISYPKNDTSTRQIIENILTITQLRIIKIERESDISLGRARNEAVAACNGPFICLWDDDDWYHFNRLSHQYKNMQVNGKYRDASILTRIVLFDAVSEQAYLSSTYYWAGTLLCRKDHVLKNPFTDSNHTEDIHLIKFLHQKKVLHLIEDSAYLYIQLYHGENLTNEFHYQYLLAHSELLDEENTNWIKEIFIVST